MTLAASKKQKTQSEDILLIHTPINAAAGPCVEHRRPGQRRPHGSSAEI